MITVKDSFIVMRNDLPNLRRAGSTLLGLLVAAITMTWDLCFRPSIKVKSWETILLSTSPCVCHKNTVGLYRDYLTEHMQ